MTFKQYNIIKFYIKTYIGTLKLSRELLRRELLERYLSTGRVGLTKPKNDAEAIDLIETVVQLYDDSPVKMSLAEVSNKLKNLLNF